MNIGEGFRNIMLAVWNMFSNTVIFPAGVVGNSSNITLLNILMLGLGALFSVKFVRYCLGGHFNVSNDNDKGVNIKSKLKNSGVNDFMHETDDSEDIAFFERMAVNGKMGANSVKHD